MTGWQNLTGINTVTEIIDDQPYLWIATDGGLIKYDKNSGEITKYNKANAGLPGNSLGAIVKINNTIWLGTRYESIGLGVFDGNGCKIYNPDNSSLKLYTDHKPLAIDNYENLWIGEISSIATFNGTDFISYDCPVNPIMSNLSIDKIVTLDNNIYVSGTWNFSDLMEIKSHTDNNNLKFLIGNPGMVGDKKNKLYFILRNGFLVYDQNNNTWDVYTPLNSNIPTTSFGPGGVDQEENIWFTSNKGLIMFNVIHLNHLICLLMMM